ncbi:MAG TPA: 23S rRNA methyltransferase, partial [Streptosporangiaceae bacterium]|nr:23S rRNA methyltransferase [Streptosporangiaceae bacterium]
MLPAVVDCLACPYCRLPLSEVDGSVRCARGHSFDLARQGYANLLVGRAPAAVDTPAMVAARAELLTAGH